MWVEDSLKVQGGTNGLNFTEHKVFINMVNRAVGL